MPTNIELSKRVEHVEKRQGVLDSEIAQLQAALLAHGNESRKSIADLKLIVETGFKETREDVAGIKRRRQQEDDIHEGERRAQARWGKFWALLGAFIVGACASGGSIIIVYQALFPLHSTTTNTTTTTVIEPTKPASAAH